MHGARTILPLALATLLALAAACLTAGPPARRRLGIAVGIASMLPVWLLPRDLELVRGVSALVAFVWTMRVIDLRRGEWTIRARLGHVASFVDTRTLASARPRLAADGLAPTLAWIALAAAAGWAVVSLTHLSGPAYWAARWSAGVVLTYSAIAALYASVTVTYAAIGFATPPLHVAPILSRSVQELWGERWARPIGRWLGETLFLPFARTRPMIGVCAAFGVSAAFHPYAVWVAMGAIDGLAMAGATLAYFVLQGAVVAIERGAGVRRWAPWAGHAWTVVWMLGPAPLFIEPILRVLGFPVASGAP